MLESLLIPMTAGYMHLASLHGQQVTCEVPQPPRIYIRPETEATYYDHTFSIPELTAKGSDTISPYAAHIETHTGGLTEAAIGMTMAMKFGLKKYPNLQLGCIWYSEITVTLELAPIVYVASDYPRGSCKYREVKLHEDKHVMVDREIVNKYAKRIGAALQRAINDHGARGPHTFERIELIQKDMEDFVGSVLKTEQSLMEEERFRRQQAIDSFEEYERVRKACL